MGDTPRGGAYRGGVTTTTSRSTAKQPDSVSARLNKLRAGVLGANDGIVSVAATVIGVAAATHSIPVIATAGFAALSAGAFSMATGEYISVSTQRDTCLLYTSDAADE